MRLLVDIGNTRIKWAWSASAGHLTDSGVGTQISDLLSTVSEYERPEEIFIVDVRNNGLFEGLADSFASLGWKRCVRIETQATHGAMRIAYAEPGKLGADRFLGLVEASVLLPAAVIVLDAGTALTVDALAGGGQHEGGVIMPGLSAVRDALMSAVPRLPPSDALDHAMLSPWGRDTETAVGNGLMYAWAGAAARVVDDMRDRLGNDCKLLVGGGDGRLLKKWLKTEAIYDESLILRGMTRL